MHPHLKEAPPPSSSSCPSSPLPSRSSWISSAIKTVTSELHVQRGIALPLMAMNLAWFAKTTTTTAFLGRLGDLELAAGTLGFTFANVTGFSVLNGLCGAMEPICGQAFGAKNYRLLHKTLLMATMLLLVTCIPISLLWLNVDTILVHFGQQREIATLAKRYIIWLLPDLVITSFLCPLKAYLSSQGVTLPTLFISGIALGLHVPLNIFLSRKRGIDGVAMAICLTDMSVAVMLSAYVFLNEKRKNWVEKEPIGGWWDQRTADWIRLLRLSAPCCMTTCLEWWCYEILVLLTGRLPDARRMVAVIAVVLNFDYLLFSVMLSLATCASTRVSNDLGAGNSKAARMSAFVSISCGALAGFIGAFAMVMARHIWGHLFTNDQKIIQGVSKMMLIMALLEVFNFPLAVCGGIVRGTARPWLGMYASLGGFYLIALPVAVILGFKTRLGLGGLLMGFVIGAAASVVVLILLVVALDWDAEAKKAKNLADAETRTSEQSDDVTI
ncbi:MATE efflux family protein 5 isoform X1 [Carex littledalei]|uniref:Protein DETOXIFICATION n=1 Tax=Carex littledalei TaxID=544730 RepID=A0A833RHX2_9POAL|nr:MATE efflux family protein 5 isoform X1 [Carex littledalei]